MNKSHHDPLPWRACCRGRKADIESTDAVAQVYLNDYRGKTVARARRGNVKLMLVACNTHGEMLEVLSEIKAMIESGSSALKGSDVHQKIKDVMARVADEESKAEKAVAPEGTPCNAFWNSSLACATQTDPASSESQAEALQT